MNNLAKYKRVLATAIQTYLQPPSGEHAKKVLTLAVAFAGHLEFTLQRCASTSVTLQTHQTLAGAARVLKQPPNAKTAKR